MASNVTERDAREVAEAARETEWTLPSFGKELFLGNFRLDLIHPQPKVDPAQAEKGERFLENLRTFLVEHVDPLEIEREAKLPEHVIQGLKDLGALGMKVPEEYGGVGGREVRSELEPGRRHASDRAVARPRARASPRSRRFCPHTSRSASVSRCACSAPRSRSASGCRSCRRRTSRP